MSAISLEDQAWIFAGDKVVEIFAAADGEIAAAVQRCSVHQGSALVVLQIVRDSVRKVMGDHVGEQCIATLTEQAKRPQVSAIVKDQGPERESLRMPKWGIPGV